jgi:hypothetical protein
MIPNEKKVRIILKGVRNVLLAFLGEHDGDMEEMEHFLTS